MKQYSVIAKFTCLGADCPDTCCRGWDMPADAAQIQRCEASAPEVLKAIDRTQGIMKREPCGDCSSLVDGLCRIHRDDGAEFLSDSCYFYPRLLQQFGNETRISPMISCPEMLRLVLSEKAPFAVVDAMSGRMPQQKRDLLPVDIPTSEAQQKMTHAMAMAQNEKLSPEQIMLQLLMLGTDDDSAEIETKASDPHTIYYALALTEAFGETGISQRLPQVMAVLEQALDCKFDRAGRNLTTGSNAAQAYPLLLQRWRMDAQAALAPVLRRWIQAQIAMTAFPFGPFNNITPAQRAAILMQRFATIRLALMCYVAENGTPPDDATTIYVIQGISRFMDHIVDADLTMMIHRDSGWESPARLRGLVAMV